jgi:hypothetical protein
MMTHLPPLPPAVFCSFPLLDVLVSYRDRQRYEALVDPCLKAGALAHTFMLFSTPYTCRHHVMSPFAAPSLTPLPESPFLAELTSRATAPSNLDAKAIADSIALSLKTSPRVLEAMKKAKIIDVSGSKSG